MRQHRSNRGYDNEDIDADVSSNSFAINKYGIEIALGSVLTTVMAFALAAIPFIIVERE